MYSHNNNNNLLSYYYYYYLALNVLSLHSVATKCLSLQSTGSHVNQASTTFLPSSNPEVKETTTSTSLPACDSDAKQKMITSSSPASEEFYDWKHSPIDAVIDLSDEFSEFVKRLSCARLLLQTGDWLHFFIKFADAVRYGKMIHNKAVKSKSYYVLILKDLLDYLQDTIDKARDQAIDEYYKHRILTSTSFIISALESHTNKYIVA